MGDKNPQSSKEQYSGYLVLFSSYIKRKPVFVALPPQTWMLKFIHHNGNRLIWLPAPAIIGRSVLPAAMPDVCTIDTAELWGHRPRPTAHHMCSQSQTMVTRREVFLLSKENLSHRIPALEHQKQSWLLFNPTSFSADPFQHIYVDHTLGSGPQPGAEEAENGWVQTPGWEGAGLHPGPPHVPPLAPQPSPVQWAGPDPRPLPSSPHCVLCSWH